MFNLELSLEELQELHVTLALRKCQLKVDIEHKSADVSAIALRQLERVEPLLYYVGEVVREHHEAEAKREALAKAEAEIEAFVERKMNALDKKLMQGHLSQADYDAQVSILNNWANSEILSFS